MFKKGTHKDPTETLGHQIIYHHFQKMLKILLMIIQFFHLIHLLLVILILKHSPHKTNNLFRPLSLALTTPWIIISNTLKGSFRSFSTSLGPLSPSICVISSNATWSSSRPLELFCNEKYDFKDNHLQKIEFLQLSHAIEIPCNYFGQVVVDM